MKNYFVSYMYLGKSPFGQVKGYGNGIVLFKDFISSAEDINELRDKLYEMASQLNADNGERIDITGVTIINYKELSPPLLTPQKAAAEGDKLPVAMRMVNYFAARDSLVQDFVRRVCSSKTYSIEEFKAWLDNDLHKLAMEYDAANLRDEYERWKNGKV